MKNLITKLILCAALLTFVGCVDDIPVTSFSYEQLSEELEACEESEDIAWGELDLCELDSASWEAEALRVEAVLSKCNILQMSVRQDYRDAIKALETVPADISEEMCSSGQWSPQVCADLAEAAY